ncbi:hypothetical protein GAY33_17045 [Azospirillum brasilense]|nr:hypothetical protein [Azospirillum argentinense]
MNVWLLPLIAMAAVQAFVGLCLFVIPVIAPQAASDLGVCLLYPSDAGDEEDGGVSVWPPVL